MKTHKPLLVLASVWMALCYCDESVGIDAGYAEYDGKSIVLDGNVTVDHDLGTISANKVKLLPETIDNETRFHHLMMLGNVLITLKDGGKLSCAEADINYRDQKGEFYSDSHQQEVIYTEDQSTALGRTPLVVKSRYMSVCLQDDTMKEGQSPHNCISRITANTAVTVTFNNDFMAASDYAAYQRLIEDDVEKSTPLPGLIILRADDDSGICHVTNRNGDIIRANHICIDTVKRQILFANPKGSLAGSKRLDNPIPVEFTSDALTWDDTNQVLTLCDHVVINQSGLGTLKTDKELHIYQRNMGGVRQLRSIEATGQTVLTHVDDEKDRSHTLTCYGKVTVDHLCLQTVMESPRDAQGKVLENKQVFFQDNMGEILADKLTIYYTMVNNKPALEKLELEGHVHLKNNGVIDPKKTKAFLEYALADIVEYTPKNEELTLASLGKRRVLFFDRVNNLQVSAPSLKIHRDKQTNQETIQGSGDVRFSFVKRELEELQKQFPSLDSNAEDNLKDNPSHE